MLISKDNVIENMDDFPKVYDGKTFDVYMNGLLYIRGMHAGDESILEVCRCIEKNGIVPFEKLFGSYTIVIAYKEVDRFIVFSDNSCMHGTFLSDNYIGSSFVEIIKKEKIKEFDDIGLCEYIALGRSGFSQRTVARGVTVSDNLSYYIVEGGEISAVNKGMDGIDGDSNITDPDAFMKDVAYALAEIPTVCGLTGGFDSRAVAVSLNGYGKFNCFISGENDTSPEIVQALKTAYAANIKMSYIKPPKTILSNEYITDMFDKWHGYKVLFGADGYRIDYFMRALADQGYKVLADGSAGDMHKEFWSTQDFPFYHRKYSNARRFLRTRMMADLKGVGNRVVESWNSVKEFEISEMKKLNKNINSKSYLCYGWQIDWRANAGLNAVSPTPIIYSPLQEIELVRYSYARVPRIFVLNHFFRSLTTRHNRAAARVATIYGTTASGEPIYVLRDIIFQILRYGKQGIRYVIKVTTGRSVFLPTINDDDVNKQLRKLEIVKDSYTWAKKEGLIDRRCHIWDVGDTLLNKIINLYLIDTLCFATD